MRGALVMTMAMISPSWREVSTQNSSAGALDWFRLVAAESRPESLLMIFFSDERLYIAEDGHRRATRGPKRQGRAQGGRARPHPRGQGVGPLWLILSPVFFINSKNCLREVSGLLELCRIGL